MSDVPPETPPPADTRQVKPTSDALTPVGRSAVQGLPDHSPPSMDISASEFKPETRGDLARHGLDNPDVVLSSGQSAEEAAQIVLKHEGLPMGNRDRQVLRDVVPGHYDASHGIDLVGVTPEGRPIPIEVKKRGDPAQDTMGQDRAQIERLEPETLALADQSLREREAVPGQRWKTDYYLSRNEPDPDLSANQMDGLWTRDRWIKLLKDDDRRAQLAAAGVSEEFLDLNGLLEAPDSPAWRQILDARTTVVVTTDKQDVSHRLLSQAALERGFNVAVINLKA